MVTYKDLTAKKSTKNVVYTFVRFSPPTVGHELLLNTLEKTSKELKAPSYVYISSSHDSDKNPLPPNRKLHYLKRIFPTHNFLLANKETNNFLTAAADINKLHPKSNLTMVVGSDRIKDFQEKLNKYNGLLFNFNDINVISAGTRDPDGDNVSSISGTKMRQHARDGNFSAFKKGLPTNITSVDAKKLMNEIRVGSGLEQITEEIGTISNLRDKFVKHELFDIGDHVYLKESTKEYVVKEFRTNYVLLEDMQGKTYKKWVTDLDLKRTQLKESIHSDHDAIKTHKSRKAGNEKDKDAFDSYINKLGKFHKHLTEKTKVHCTNCSNRRSVTRDLTLAHERLRKADYHYFKGDTINGHRHADIALQMLHNVLTHLEYSHNITDDRQKKKAVTEEIVPVSLSNFKKRIKKQQTTVPVAGDNGDPKAISPSPIQMQGPGPSSR